MHIKCMCIYTGTRYKQLTIVTICLRVGTDWGDRTRSRKDTFPVTFCAFWFLKLVTVFPIWTFWKHRQSGNPDCHTVEFDLPGWVIRLPRAAILTSVSSSGVNWAGYGVLTLQCVALAWSHTWRVFGKQGPILPPWLISLKCTGNWRFWPFVVISVYFELGRKCWFSAVTHLTLIPCFHPLLNSNIWGNWNALNVWVCLEQLFTFLFENYGSLYYHFFSSHTRLPSSGSAIRMDLTPFENTSPWRMG